jgi:hypothetical protein
MNTTHSGTSIVGLIKEMTHEIKTLIKGEFELAKSELSENFAKFSRNGAFFAAGAILALIAAILFFFALGMLISYAFESAGVSSAMADFLGLGIMGLLIGGIGSGFILKAIKAFSKESLAPKRTIETIKDIQQGATTETEITEEFKPKKSSDQLQSEVYQTEAELGETIDELSHRLSPQYAGQQMTEKIQAHPYRWGLVAMCTGLLSSFMLVRKFKHP